MAAVAVTVPLYGGCFGTDGFLGPLLGAALLGGAVALLSTARRWGAWRTTVAVLVGALLLIVAVLTPTASAGIPTGQTWQALRDGLIGGWLRLLTSGVPMDVTPTLLLTPVLATYGCALAAAAAALRTQRVLLPAAPALLALVAALTFGASLLTPSLALTGGWLMLVAGTVLLRANRVGSQGLHLSREAALAVGLDLAAMRRHALLGRLAFGAPMAVAVVVVGVAATAVLPIADGAHRLDLRTLVSQPFSVDEAITPLATVQSQQVADPPQPLFTVRAEGARTHLIRVAVLDDFDGATWTPRVDFLPAGHLLPADPLLDGGSPITLRVNVTRLDSPFLPVAGTPQAVDGHDLGYGPQSAMLVAHAGTTAPLEYTVTGAVGAYETMPADATVASPANAADYLALPPPPAVLTEIATRITAGAFTPYGKLLLLAAYLRAQPYDLTARPGHSYGAITRMLARARPGDENGFDEQHASAFAVLARILGIPSRVAVGYVVDPSRLVSGQDVVVTSRNAHAWAEVPIQGFGWVPFETVDLTSTPVTVAPQDEQAAPSLDRAGPIQVSNDAGVSSGDAAAGADAGVAAILRGVAVGGFVVLLIVLLTAALVIGEKARRRWRRRQARTPTLRVLGAWREVEDRLIERGVRSPPSASAAETAAAAAHDLGPVAAAAGQLVPIMGTTLYGPEEPDLVTVRDAWKAENELRAALSRSRPWPRRVLTALDPRPIIRLPRRTARQRSRARGRR